MGRKAQCEEEGCCKLAIADGTRHCKAHGGGKRCQQEAGGLHQVRSEWRHSSLSGAGFEWVLEHGRTFRRTLRLGERLVRVQREAAT